MGLERSIATAKRGERGCDGGEISSAERENRPGGGEHAGEGSDNMVDFHWAGKTTHQEGTGVHIR